jgi:hypothetical protein
MLLALLFILAQESSPLDPPAGQKENIRAEARGVQVYTCEGSGDDFRWTLDHPEAELLDEKGQNIGRHFAGPSWEMIDHSRMSGKISARKSSPDGSIPWMLIAAESHSGSGMLQHIEFVQRINTTGGIAPTTGCDAAHAKAKARIPYTATYVFFRPAPK